jgi:hypothetical protein
VVVAVIGVGDANAEGIGVVAADGVSCVEDVAAGVGVSVIGTNTVGVTVGVNV